MMEITEAQHRLAQRHVVIGAGEAGTRAAIALRNAGARHITLIDAEDSLPYERPPLSKPEGDEVTIRHIASSFDGIDTRFGGSVSSIDRETQQVMLSSGKAVPYDWLLLATGARPRTLSVGAASHVRSLRNRDDAAAIYRRIATGRNAVIIGAGLIGLELAAVLRARGMSVTILQSGARALARVLPQSLSEELVNRHGAEGVKFVFNARVVAIGAHHVVLDGGEEFAADLIVVAIGAIPNTELAEAAGLSCDNGIHVDEGLRTSDPHIFAAGDCAALLHPVLGRVRFECWRNACDQGAVVASAMLGQEARFATQPWFWSDQYDLGVQMVGVHDPSRQTIKRELPNGGWILFEIDQRGVLCAASGISSGRGVAKDIRLAEMLIDRAVAVSATSLSDCSVNLKSFLPRD